MFQHVKEGGEHGRGEEKPFNTSSEEKYTDRTQQYDNKIR